MHKYKKALIGFKSSRGAFGDESRLWSLKSTNECLWSKVSWWRLHSSVIQNNWCCLWGMKVLCCSKADCNWPLGSVNYRCDSKSINIWAEMRFLRVNKGKLCANKFIQLWNIGFYQIKLPVRGFFPSLFISRGYNKTKHLMCKMISIKWYIQQKCC